MFYISGHCRLTDRNADPNRKKPAPGDLRLFSSEYQGVLEAAVPSSVLGAKPSPGLKLKGDVGVLFSDEGAANTVFRA